MLLVCFITILLGLNMTATALNDGARIYYGDNPNDFKDFNFPAVVYVDYHVIPSKQSAYIISIN
jgi:hypothetical protein